MRNIFRKLLVTWLGLLARGVLARHHPRIVAVTGSVGKTTTKELTRLMLTERFRVRTSQGNYNTEIGLPLTVFGVERPQHLTGWFGISTAALALLFQTGDYPEVLVLEMAADKPGDIKHLTAIAPPDISIVTNVRGVHLEFYDSVEAIAEEKSWAVRRLRPGGIAILNFDDTTVRMMRSLASDAPGAVRYYGLTDEADVWLTDITQDRHGQQATLHLKESGQTFKFTTPLLGRHQLYSVLAAFTAATVSGVDPEQALAAASKFETPPGRLRVLAGKDGLTLLDDTYNASPQAMLDALEVLKGFPGPHRAVLGEMKELGAGREQGHTSVGEALAPWLDELVVVGDDAALIAEGAKRAGMDPAKIHFAGSAPEAVQFVNRDGRGGTVLLKASQSVYLERATIALLKDHRDARQVVQRLKDPAHQAQAAGSL